MRGMKVMDYTLTKLEQSIENELRNNYIKNYANLVADNIVIYHKYYGNNINLSFFSIKRMSKDNFIFNLCEERRLDNLICSILKYKYKLKVNSTSENDKLMLEKV